MPDRLSVKADRVVGTKQVLRLLHEDNVKTLFIAMDIDDDLKETLEAAIPEGGVDLVRVATMADLGVACEIDVGAACAAITKRDIV